MEEPVIKTWHEHVDFGNSIKFPFDRDVRVIAQFLSSRDGDRWDQARVFASFSIPAPTEYPLVVMRADASLTGIQAGRYASRTGSIALTLEQIAKWVEGDGTNAQNMALADGIRAGLPFTQERR